MQNVIVQKVYAKDFTVSGVHFTGVAAVDDSGNVTTNKAGTAHITVTATDKYGFAETSVCTVTVRYNWWQWLIRIFLFGWLWY